MLLSSMLPGPDFAMVTKNTFFHSKRAGIFTSLGVGTAILVHITYCMLGLAIVISHSTILFNLIKYAGASYLIYIGLSTFKSKSTDYGFSHHNSHIQTQITRWKAFKQGFFCNLLNPKATLFFLALFTVVIKQETSLTEKLIYAIEMFTVITAWFCSLTVILSHPFIMQYLQRAEKYIMKGLGLFLMSFGLILALVKLH
jgi:RhtB (resistance to homoserine/threonine) family protein